MGPSINPKRVSQIGISSLADLVSTSKIHFERKKQRDSFAFGKSYLEELKEKVYHYEPTDDSQPCPPRNSDIELDRARANLLPNKCKRHINFHDSGEGDEDEDANKVRKYHEPPDFDQITTYDEYLDHYISDTDLYYFESEYTARIITSLGYRIPELLTKQQFKALMESREAEKLEKRNIYVNISREIGFSKIKCPVMRELALREEANRTGQLATIIFIRTVNHRGQEISSWIDYRLRLKTDDKLWYQYFTGKRKLTPRMTDLCFYNYATFKLRYNSSEDYLVTTDIKKGVQFENKLDRKRVTVDPMKSPGENTERLDVRSKNYLQCIILDHYLRVKA